MPSTNQLRKAIRTKQAQLTAARKAGGDYAPGSECSRLVEEIDALCLEAQVRAYQAEHRSTRREAEAYILTVAGVAVAGVACGEPMAVAS